MTSLLELQRALGVALLTGSDEVAKAIVANGIAPAARLNVYRNNVIGNLTGALKLSFPAVERLVGPDFFAADGLRFAAALCEGVTLSEALGTVEASVAAGLLGDFLARGLFSGILESTIGGSDAEAGTQGMRQP